MDLNLNDHEQAILDKAAKEEDLSKTAVVKRWMRLGQLIDSYATRGYELRFLGPEGLVDPFKPGKKLNRSEDGENPKG